MKKIVKPFIIITIFSLITFLGCTIVGLLIFNPNESINHTFAIKFLESIELFGDIFPPVVFVAFLIAFSWEFSTEKSVTNTRLSENRMACLKAIYVVGLMSSLCLFVYKELLIPTAVAKKHKYESDYLVIQKYINQATEQFDEGNYDFAKFYIEQALMISPKNKEYTEFREKVLLAKANEDKWNFEHELDDSIFTTDLINIDETEISLLEKARWAYQNKQYFDSHYYASNAIKFAGSNSPNADYAKALAADAWNKMVSDFDEYDSTFKEFQATKKEGYVALLQGDFCEAYYIFQELLDNKLFDEYNLEDIKKYKNEAEASLTQQYFFIDEAMDMEGFESFTDVYFSYDNNYGGKDVFFIGGISLLQESGEVLQYCRDFSYYSFDENANLLKSLYTPYCKMFPKSGKVFGSTNKFVPYIQLISVDRKNRNFKIEPTSWGMDKQQSYMVLDLPYEDFNMIRQASKGVEKMPLSLMFKFSNSAKKYGFQAVAYSCNFATRLLYPLKTMILFLVLGILAWKFRLMPGRRVQKSWYLTIPFFSVIMYMALEVFDYFDAMNYFVINFSMGFSTMGILTTVYLVLIAFFSSWFVLTKS